MSDDEGSDNGEPQYQVVFEGDDPSKKPDKYLRKDGKAAAKFANDDTYVGEYRSGKRHGKGVYTFASGARYEGDYVDGVKEGEGDFLLPDGSVYSGQWKADKRHGQGTYVYAKTGDAYTGEWANDRKHGKGTYTYAQNGSSITGVWSNGQIMHGSWNLADGSKLTSAWHKNQPSGFGLHKFTNGNQIVGTYSLDKKEGYKWNAVAPVLSAPNAESKVVTTPDPLKVASRFIEKCLLKLDHFEGIYRLKKEVEGCPNLRRIPDVAVFALGQPTISGLKAFVEWAAEQHSTDKFIWVNLRAEPIVYVNNQSFVPRSKHALNAPMSLRGLAAVAAASASSSSSAAAEGPEPLLTPEQLSTIESSLVSKLTLDISHRGNLHSFLKDTFAEQAADRKNLEMSEEVKPEVDEDSGAESYASAIQTPSKLFADLAENDGVDCEYQRMPWSSGGVFPKAEDVDQIVQIVKNNESTTGIVFNDQMGRGRSTLASVIVTLMRRTADALASADERDNPALGRTDHEGLEIPEYDEADPNYKSGQYAIIMRLVREGLAPAAAGSAAAAGAQASSGDQIKAEVDDAVDRCKAMQNLREIILFAKEMHDKEAASAESGSGAAPSAQAASESRRAFWRESAQNSLHRYAMLMLFQSYVKSNIESEYENQTFSQFCKERQEIIDSIVGSKTSGPLKDFRWQ